jgi:phosphoribosylamine--glycine ligase
MDLGRVECEFTRWPSNLSLAGEALQQEFKRLAIAARDAKVDLVVVGPDNPLADGIVDVFEQEGLRVFGPRRAAAQLEASKGFAKEVMKAAGVPTARYFMASSSAEAQKILKSVPWPKDQSRGWVVKADGLALGKGVRVCTRFEEASQAATELISVSGSLVIEELLSGEEISWLAFCDGESCALLEPARDYKRLGDGGEGPNTGGMGAFSPVPEVPSHWKERVRSEVFLPTLREMKKRGTPFKGVLYAGLMCDFANDRFWVLEFNARFGDPETQVLLPRFQDDLYDWCEAVALERVGEMKRDVGFVPQVAVGVVGAARGYPERPEKGKPLLGAAGVAPEYFFAGVSRSGKDMVSSGGRVFLALGLGEDFEKARALAYERIRDLSFEGMQYRTDIAVGALGGVR